MMERINNQMQLLILDIDSMIPENHLLRQIKKGLMDDVSFSFCHLYAMYRDLLFCHNKKGPPNDIYCIIEEPSKYYFTEKPLQVRYFRKTMYTSFISSYFFLHHQCSSQ